MFNNDVLSCWYDVYLNGQPVAMGVKRMIESISITESASGCSVAQIVINDTDFTIVDDDIFVEDVPVKIEGGWDGCIYRFSFEGYIAAIDIDFGLAGYPVVTLHLMDATHLMNREAKCASWENVTSRDVVTQVANSYGFGVCIYPVDYDFTQEEAIIQSDMTDIAFLRQLADKESSMFVCYLMKDGRTIYYGLRSAVSTPTMDLWYRSDARNIISFQPRINRETVRERVTSADISPGDKAASSYTSDAYTAERELLGNPVITSDSATGGASDDKSGMRFCTRTNTWVRVHPGGSGGEVVTHST